MAEAKYGRLFTEKDVRGLIVLALTHPAVENPYRVADTVLSGEFGTYELTFPAEEPLFLLRGQDRAAIGGVTGYYVTAKAVGASQDHGLAVVDAARRFAEFAQASPDRLKVPD